MRINIEGGKPVQEWLNAQANKKESIERLILAFTILHGMADARDMNFQKFSVKRTKKTESEEFKWKIRKKLQELPIFKYQEDFDTGNGYMKGILKQKMQK